MAKKQKDQHKSGLMVRLPEEYRPKLLELKAKNRRPTTTEVQIALDKHLQSEGIKPVSQ